MRIYVYRKFQHTTVYGMVNQRKVLLAKVRLRGAPDYTLTWLIQKKPNTCIAKKNSDFMSQTDLIKRVEWMKQAASH